MKHHEEKTETRRARGRPPAETDPGIRSALLDAAEHLFAEKGYAATSLREIADRAGVNPAMIHYYFGNKRSLLEQVLEQVLEPLAQAINRMRETEHAPPGDIVRLMLQVLSEHPSMPLLVVREAMLPGGMALDYFLHNAVPRIGGAIPGLLAKEQEMGRVSSRIDPNLGTLILLSLSLFPFIVRRVAETGLYVSYDEQGLSKLKQHISWLLEEGFSP